MAEEKLETKFDKPRYKISLFFTELINLFRENTRSRVKRMISLVQEKNRADSLDEENQELKSALSNAQVSLKNFEKFKEKTKASRVEADKVPRLESIIANLTRKLSAKDFSPAEVEVQEKIAAAGIAMKAMKKIEKTRKQLKEAGDEMKEIVKGLTSSLTERGEMPLIIEASHFKEAEEEIITLQGSFRTSVDEDGQAVLLLENPMFDQAVEEYIKSIDLKKDPNQWNEAFETILQALGYFKAAKLFEDLMVSQYTKESQGITPEQQQSINSLKTKNSGWIEDTEKGEWLKDFYQVLGVQKEATIQEIKTAYRRGAKQCHPDKNGGAETEKFTAINAAYQVLRNEELRNKYNNYYNIFF